MAVPHSGGYSTQGPRQQAPQQNNAWADLISGFAQGFAGQKMQQMKMMQETQLARDEMQMKLNAEKELAKDKNSYNMSLAMMQKKGTELSTEKKKGSIPIEMDGTTYYMNQTSGRTGLTFDQLNTLRDDARSEAEKASAFIEDPEKAKVEYDKTYSNYVIGKIPIAQLDSNDVKGLPASTYGALVTNKDSGVYNKDVSFVETKKGAYLGDKETIDREMKQANDFDEAKVIGGSYTLPEKMPSNKTENISNAEGFGKLIKSVPESVIDTLSRHALGINPWMAATTQNIGHGIAPDWIKEAPTKSVDAWGRQGQKQLKDYGSNLSQDAQSLFKNFFDDDKQSQY